MTPPSVLSLNRIRNVPDRFTFSSFFSCLRLTKPRMSLGGLGGTVSSCSPAARPPCIQAVPVLPELLQVVVQQRQDPIQPGPEGETCSTVLQDGDMRMWDGDV